MDVRAPKYGSERTVYLAAGLVEILAKHVAEHCPGNDPHRWLFTGATRFCVTCDPAVGQLRLVTAHAVALTSNGPSPSCSRQRVRSRRRRRVVSDAT